jgi:hypothetical protein
MELYLHYGKIFMLTDNFAFKFKEESMLQVYQRPVCRGLNKAPGSYCKTEAKLILT